MKAKVYCTNYHVEIQGGFRPHGGHLLIINNSVRIPLQFLQWIILYLLACHARTKAGLTAPEPINGGYFLSPKSLEELIAAEKARHPELTGSLEIVPPELIYNAKWQIRQRIRRRDKNPNLIEALDELGYCLSTVPGRIRITLIGQDGSVQVWDWTE